MREFFSSVSPKGQVTLPVEVRRRWGIKPRDRVTFLVEDGSVTLVPAQSPLDESYGAVPPLKPALSVEEMTEIAAEEHALEVARKGISESAQAAQHGSGAGRIADARQQKGPQRERR